MPKQTKRIPMMGMLSIPKSQSVLGWCAVGAAAFLLTACSSGPSPSSSKKGKFDPKYGVSASARVATQGKEFRKGGGHYKIGRPYKVAGRRYVPKHEPGYNKTGKASWYGDDFHGRLTANGEIFNMNDLTAAHPTLPLPSYARVTNLKNGRSVIVRINDRGPYAHNRIIDLSKRVAQVLDFKHDGITDVRVKYIGKARMDGQDARYLEASYRSRGQRIGDDRRAVPGEGEKLQAPARVMVASAKRPAPKKKKGNYLLAHVPPLGSPSSSAPSPFALNKPAPSNAWAPIDLTGDGYRNGAETAALRLADAAPIQLNYASTQQRVSEGHAAIASLFEEKKTSHLLNVLSNRAERSQNARQTQDGMSLGRFEAGYGMRIAQEFAHLAAVNIIQHQDGQISLSLSHLKSGVLRSDINALKMRLGLLKG